MEKCLFVYNAQSGKGKVKRKEKEIVSLLSQRYYVEVYQSEYAGHISQIIEEKGNVELIVVAGGDGTLNEVVNAIMQIKSKAKIGYIPTGTVNDVAHSLGIKKNIKKAVKDILEGCVFKHDVFKVNDRYGIYVCCSGLFTETSYETSQKQKRKIGKIAYALHGCKKIFSTKSLNLKLEYEGGIVEGKFAIMLLINSRSVAGFKINKRACLNDGLIDVVLIKSKKDKVGVCSVLNVATFFLNGIKKKNNKNIIKLKLNKFHVEIPENTTINLDGERVSNGSFDFSVIKEGISIIIPKNFKLIKN